MSDEAIKEKKQDQTVEQTGAAGVPQATAADAQAPPAIDADNGVSPLPKGAPAEGVQEPQQGSDCPNAAQQTGAEAVVSSDSPDIASDTQGECDRVPSGGQQTEQEPVSADGTNTPQAEVSPETKDLMTVTDEPDEERELIAHLMRSYEDVLGRESIY